ncbi:hypothetical protein [Gorillibacterium massiliense]|uniref:hypothetical protein n=1 Tax=Gorillibacterium massiliense TaxID=1280390 RepID=UPI0004BBAF16|nr:hypothetical protein [Gorillibacterium massiliense]
MSVDILFDLQQETRRLFIAGSAMAAGDLRLTKILPSLRKLGESAPVFKRLADAVDELLTADWEESAAKLLELGTLLSAVLYTQGKTETAGESQPVEGTPIGFKTDVPYRKLHPLIEALTTKGQGRLEQLRAAFEDGSFLDLRAIPAVCSALDESYSEIPDFVQEKMIPAFGRDAVPVLRSQLNLQGGKGDGRRLLLLHCQLGGSMIELVTESAVSGSPEVKIAAISILGEYPEQEPLLLELSLEKRKEVRIAVYFSLAKVGTGPAFQQLYKAATSKDRELAVEPIKMSESPELLVRIINYGEEALKRYSNLEGSDKNEAVEQIRIVIRCLEGSGKRMAAEAYPFLWKLLSTDAFLVQETETVQEAAAELLLELDIPEADRFAVELGDNGKGPFIRHGFCAANKLMAPADVYLRFAGVLSSGKSKVAKELLVAIRGLAANQLQADEEQDGLRAVSEAAWDPRWIRQFIRLDQPDLVCLFAQRSDPEITDFLSSKLKDTQINDRNVMDMLLTLFRIRFNKAPELLMGILEKSSARSLYYLNWKLKQLIANMPRAYAPRLRAFAEQLAYESVRNEMMPIVEALEEKQMIQTKRVEGAYGDGSKTRCLKIAGRKAVRERACGAKGSG